MSSGREAKVGTLKVRVIRGRNLAMRDLRGSDPYVIVRAKNQHAKTKVIKKNVNPEWNEELTMHAVDSTDPIRLEVFDRDRFSHDDPMGRVSVDIRALFKAKQAPMVGDGVIKVIPPGIDNFLVAESVIHRRHGMVIQDMILRLQEAECGEIELQLEV